MIESIFIAISVVLLLFYSSYFLFGIVYGKSLRYSRDFNYTPNVSLIIPTYNEERIIDRKIEDVTSLDYPIDKFEILFIDSSTDGTTDKIRKFKTNTNYNVMLVNEGERKGLANALNVAYSMAHGDIVIKTDCDMLLERDSVRNLVSYLNNENVGAANGKLCSLNKSGTEEGYIGLIERIKIAESNLDSSHIFAPFSAFKKDLIETIDPKSVADDGELALKIRRKGFKTIFVPDAIFYEATPIPIIDRIKQKSRRAQGHLMLIFQNIDLIFNSKHGYFGTVIFPSHFFMMILSPLFFSLLVISSFYLSYLNYSFYGLFLPFMAIIMLAVVYIKSSPKCIAGFIETQICLLLAALRLLLKGPDFMWKKNENIRSEYVK